MARVITVSYTHLDVYKRQVTGSFKDVIEINSRVPIWFPQNPTVDNYARLFENPAFLWLFNIVFISAMAMFCLLYTSRCV